MRALGRWLLWSLVGLVVMTIALRVTAIRWWHVPDDDPWLDASIAPSLHGGDWLLLWRLTEPALGSLVVCPEPRHPDRITIGRLIGEERDHVKVEASRIFVNEKPFGSEGDCGSPVFTVTSPQGGDVEQRCSMEVAHGTIHERGEAVATSDVQSFEGERPYGRSVPRERQPPLSLRLAGLRARRPHQLHGDRFLPSPGPRRFLRRIESLSVRALRAASVACFRNHPWTPAALAAIFRGT